MASMNKKRSKDTSAVEKSKLQVAVDSTPDVEGNFKLGLKAIESKYSGQIISSRSNPFTGSVDIDKATKKIYPGSNRWDYAIEYLGDTYFVEFHPANTSEVNVVLSKLTWLRQWLMTKASAIDAIKVKDKQPYHWVFSGGNHILKNSRYWKQLSLKKLLPVKVLDFDKT